MTRSRQSNEMWDDFFSEKFATCIMQLIAKNGGNHMCKYAQITVVVLLNCNQIAWLLAIFLILAKGPKAPLWLPQWFYRYLLRQIVKKIWMLLEFEGRRFLQNVLSVSFAKRAFCKFFFVFEKRKRAKGRNWPSWHVS